jgi:hypothetical protein
VANRVLTSEEDSVSNDSNAYTDADTYILDEAIQDTELAESLIGTPVIYFFDSDKQRSDPATGTVVSY